MPPRLSSTATRRLRLRAQGLIRRGDNSSANPAAVVRALCAVQAQEAPSAALALRARASGLTAARVETARLDERSFLRTWVLRGTLHLVAPEDLGWLLALLTPRVFRNSQRRHGQLGLTGEVLARAPKAIQQLLRDQGPLTRAELASKLAQRGIPTDGQAAYHLIRHAGLQGLVCYGPDREGEPTVALLADWAPIDRAPAESAAAVLARRYLMGHGPAAPQDLASWAGLTLRQSRAAFEALADELLEVEAAESPAWLPLERASWLEDAETLQPPVRLIPAYDPYLLGYRGRELIVAPEYARRIHPGGGLLRPTLLVDGLAAGTWRLKRRRNDVEVQVAPFEALSAEVETGLEQEARDVGRFLGSEATFTITS